MRVYDYKYNRPGISLQAGWAKYSVPLKYVICRNAATPAAFTLPAVGGLQLRPPSHRTHPSKNGWYIIKA